MSNAPILLVDDDPHTTLLLSNHLAQGGFTTAAVHTASEALRFIASGIPRLAIIDLSLPDMDGRELCRKVRSVSSIPIIVLSGHSQIGDKVLALKAGADDYLTKPWNIDELVARVDAVLRRCAGSTGCQVFEHGDLSLDLRRRVATLDGEPLHLTRTEFRLLCTLMSTPGRVYMRHELRSLLYPAGSTVIDRVIDVHVANLRQKLGEDRGHPRYIRTVRAIGYAFADSDEHELA